MITSTSSAPSTSRQTAATPRRTRKSAMKTAAVAAVAAVAALGATAVNAAPFEPPDGQVLFGMWFDPADPYFDTPVQVNERLGFNVPVFQLAQAIPRPAFNWTTGAGGPAPERLIEQSGTDAAVFLTVYPEPNGFDGVTTADYEELGKQISDYQSTYNRTTFLRFAPEMQGTWMSYGMQPTMFLQQWVEMYNTVKSIAPDTIIVWAPNTPQGYPYGQQGAQFSALSVEDQNLLDTNNNGRLDAGDDSLAPYYPGDQYVDWIGLSVYYKGIPSDVRNNEQAPGYCAQVISGTNPADNANITNFYDTYCAQKPDKACMFAEAAAAYHVNDTTSTTTEEELQQAWLLDCVVNPTFYEEFPRMKMYMHFEHEKPESANDGSIDMRDFRITNNTAVLEVLKGDLSSAGTLFSWGNPRATPTSISSAGAPAATNSDGQSVIQAITATTRAKPTGFPSLFGLTSDGSQRAEFIELGVMLAAGVVGAWSVMRVL
ncbi:hypothetical protein JCM11251_007392 [Rhodosporidiobolus azoricus]